MVKRLYVCVVLGTIILSVCAHGASIRAPRPGIDTGDLAATGNVGEQFSPTVVNGFSLETATINNLTVTGTATFTGLINAAAAQLILPVSNVTPTTNLVEGSIVDVGGLLYMYDATRNVWLSVDRHIVWSARAGSVTNGYLRLADSVPTNATGFLVMRTATITGMSVSSGGNVWFVASVGGDFPDLQTALASGSVVNGDTIKLNSEIWTTPTQINVNKSVTIEGCGVCPEIRTAGTAGDPVNVLNITVGNVVLKNICVNQRKTTNTTLESAIDINAPGATGIVIRDSIALTTMEYGIKIDAVNQFSIENCVFNYQGAAGNTHRFIAVFSNNGNSRIINNQFTPSSDSPARTIFCALLAGPYAGSLLLQGNVQLVGGNLRQFYIQEGFAGAAGGFQLYFSNNSYNDTNGGIIFFAGAPNPLNLFSSIVLANNTVSNGAGKGLVGFDGFGAGLPSGLTTWYVDGNVIANPAITAPGWASASAVPGLIGFNAAVFAPFMIIFSSTIPTPPAPPVKFTAQIRLNGCPTVVSSMDLYDNNGFETNLNVPILAGDRIQTYLSGTAINPTVGVEYAYRLS